MSRGVGTSTEAPAEALFKQSQVQVLLAVGLSFLFAIGYMLFYLKSGWLPEDDGILAQSALRVLHSQLPHRDFVEVYTGGLSCLNALAFRIFGVNLLALRWMMFAFFLAWLPSVYYVASRFLAPVPASAIMVLAAVWSVPNYPTPMPSWYNMFFATMGAATLMRYLESERLRWLFLAGFCGSLSCLTKIIGLYYVAAVLLFLLFREQLLSRTEETEATRPSFAFRAFSITGLLLFLAIIVNMMRHRFDDREFVQFLLPSAAMVGLLIWCELRKQPSVGDARRFATLFRMVVPFTAGLAVPILIFLTPYIASGSLNAFTRGVFGGGMARAQALSFLVRPEHAHHLGFVLPLLVIVAAGAFWKRNLGPMLAIPVACAGILLLLASLNSAEIAQEVWQSVALSVPVFVSLGALILLHRPSVAALSRVRQQQFALLLSVVAVCSLVQFPFSVKIYFCYFAPLLVLAVAGVVATTKRAGNPVVLACVLVFYALFAMLRVAPAVVYDNRGFKPTPPMGIMNIERAGGLRVEYSGMYQEAIQAVAEHGGAGALIATPDCPEVYFLSGLRNPTNSDNALAPEELLRALRENDDVNVVVLNNGSVFAQSSLTPEVIDAVVKKYPMKVNVGRYWIFWRHPATVH